jgi:hypothetical protein
MNLEAMILASASLSEMSVSLVGFLATPWDGVATDLG